MGRAMGQCSQIVQLGRLLATKNAKSQKRYLLRLVELFTTFQRPVPVGMGTNRKNTSNASKAGANLDLPRKYGGIDPSTKRRPLAQESGQDLLVVAQPAPDRLRLGRFAYASREHPGIAWE